jgi:large subunit ribosomal protein L22
MEKNSKKTDNLKAKVTDKAKVAEVKPKAKVSKLSAKKAPLGDKKITTEVKASARFIRMSPKKVRLVTNLLAGKGAENALNYLIFVNKAAALPVTKLIKSAIANGENNFRLDKADLYIKQIIVNDGPVLKRWQPRAHGRSTPIKKKTSHIMLTLGVLAGAKKKVVAPKPSQEKTDLKSEEVKVVKPEEVKKDLPKSSGKGPQEKGRGRKGFFKGIFQRKTG